MLDDSFSPEGESSVVSTSQPLGRRIGWLQGLFIRALLAYNHWLFAPRGRGEIVRR